MRKAVILITAVLILVLVNVTIQRKEALLAEGQVVLLELAPVDPRSLMQGDYMALRFAVDGEIRQQLREHPGRVDGHAVLAPDAQGIARFRRLDNGTALAPGELRMRYRIRGDTVRFATNAFFFEEGTAERYARAHYGVFRVDADGEALLTGLRD